MPYRPDGDFLQDDDSQWDVEPREPEGGAWWKWTVAGLSLVLFGGVIWYAYQSGSAGPIGPVRTVEADPTPYKVKPENPGGEIIPDQDKLVFNEAVGRATDTEDILGKPAEQPVAKPESVPVRKFVPPKPPAPPPVATAPDTLTTLSQQLAPDTPPAATLSEQAGKPAAPDPAKVAAKTDADRPAPVPVIVQPAQPPAVAEPAKDAPTGVPQVAEPKPEGARSSVVQLGAYGSEAGAMESWAQAQRKQGQILAGLTPQVIRFTAPGKGELYRLVVGPFADRNAATDVCAQLKANGRDCIVNAN
ncbi:MAG: SPOR domain-containing protein [Sphingomonadales bacterium]